VSDASPLDRVLAALPQAARQNGHGFMARCPVHADDRASLSISEGDDGRVLLRCHAGCEARAIVDALHLEWRDLFPPRERSSADVEAVYDYVDEAGALLFQVVRFPGKNFKQRRPDGAGGWIWNLHDVRRVLYRLPELKGRTTVLIPEGEKDVESLRHVGAPATCNSGGAGKWRDEYTQQLLAAGVECVAVLPDNDATGEAHARMVARSCRDAGLWTKIIVLPGLPPKGDVTDYLRTHTKQDLAALIQAAPEFSAEQPVAAAPKLAMTSIADFLREPEDQAEWLIDDRIPAGGVVLLAGTPKAGKSTLARDLAFAVATGERWLSWQTHQGAVWYIAFEDKRSEVRRAFKAMGATGSEPLQVLVGEAPTDLLPALHALATTERPALIIVDTLQRLIRAKDMSDYAEVTERMTPLLRLARDTGAALVLVHHASIHAQREGVLDGVLGSTALVGSVDNTFLLRRSEKYRTLASIQRVGPDLEPLVIERDKTTGRLQPVGSKRDADEQDVARRILEAMREESSPDGVTEAWIKSHVVGCANTYVPATLRSVLLRRGQVVRTGKGGKRDPYRYHLPDSGFEVSPVRTDENLQNLQTEETGNLGFEVLAEDERPTSHDREQPKGPHEIESDSGFNNYVDPEEQV
jgi:archaellum biogenesis ATPase FlaH